MDMNPITIDRIKIADYSHIEGILVLQELYLVDNLSAQENKRALLRRGFQ
jgi:hypothetical protein